MHSTNGKILVAEEPSPNRTILVHLLKKLGFETVECKDGKVAWNYLEKNNDIVAVFSDVIIAEINGIDLLKNVRSHSALKGLPFVLITAVSDKKLFATANSMNVNGYILKPVTFQRVTSKLEEIFPSKKLPKVAG